MPAQLQSQRTWSVTVPALAWMSAARSRGEAKNWVGLGDLGRTDRDDHAIGAGEDDLGLAPRSSRPPPI